MSAVEDQYTRWIYPIPVEDMRAAIAQGSYWEIGDPLLYYPLFWPHKRSVENLDILVAGCGSVQAAYYACRNPNWRVTGVDISESSLAHQQKLKDRHGLSNLTLKKLELENIEHLKNSYDFIVSTGVLHHLPNPDLGLAALKRVLRPDGVINLMVYGKSLRLGVYMMQEVFRLLGLEQKEEDVEIVKATINDLPSEHVLRRYLKYAGDLHYDAAYVDTFLHPSDRAYYVNEVYAFTRRAGLEFLTWCDPLEYCLDANVPNSHPLWKRLHGLPPETAAHVCDLLMQVRGTHRWAAAHPEYVKKSRIPFETEDFLECSVSLHRLAKFTPNTTSDGNKISLCTRGNSSSQVHHLVKEIIESSSGKQSVGKIISGLRLLAGEREQLLILAREQISRLHRQGYIYIFLPEEELTLR